MSIGTVCSPGPLDSESKHPLELDIANHTKYQAIWSTEISERWTHFILFDFQFTLFTSVSHRFYWYSRHQLEPRVVCRLSHIYFYFFWSSNADIHDYCRLRLQSFHFGTIAVWFNLNKQYIIHRPI